MQTLYLITGNSAEIITPITNKLMDKKEFESKCKNADYIFNGLGETRK